jgi:DNA-binding response OmpR family regulator
MGKSILYVEDMEDWRSLVSSALNAEGFQLVTANDASEAMAACDSTTFNLVILDLKLKGESGIMLMRFLKHNHPDVPILIYTGLEHDEPIIEMFRNEGADGYLHKGSMEDLLKKVQLMVH